ncbi:MAG: transcription termination factor Rho, partial [Gemmataceae bacterium]|nr:transcription termination factor Rho [Gemmataceae bacterium]
TRLTLETDPDRLTARVLDLITPLGKGQRGRIVGPPGAGATTLLQAVAAGLAANHPESRVFVLLVDGPTAAGPGPWHAVHPSAEVVITGPEQSAADRANAWTALIRRAEQVAETGGDAVVLIDSLNGLVKVLDAVAPRIGGWWSATSEAWAQARQLFRPASGVEGGGSLTILATIRTQTKSGWDTRIDDEFRGCGNVEVHLDQRLVENGIWPAINPVLSRTLGAELLVPAEELKVMRVVRSVFADVHPSEAMEMFLRQLKRFRTNADFVRHHVRDLAPPPSDQGDL